jgi:hypothetical protein
MAIGRQLRTIFKPPQKILRNKENLAGKTPFMRAAFAIYREDIENKQYT